MIDIFKKNIGIKRVMIKGKKIIFFELFCLAVILFNSFGLNFFGEFTLIAFVIALFIISVFLFGYRKNRSIYLQTVLTIIIIWCLMFIVLQYIAGLFVGFLTTAYAKSFFGIFKNISTAVIMLVASELLRYVIIFKNGNNKLGLVLATAFFALIDVTIRINYVNFANPKQTTLFFAIYLLPSISKSILLTYLSKKTGALPCIVYRLLMEIYVFFIPLFPDLGNYFNSLLSIVFPLVLLYRMFVLFKPKDNKALSDVPYRKVVLGVIISLLLIMAILISNTVRFYAVVIATGSMEPNISVGDIVVVDKYYKEHTDKINKGDVLTFSKEGRAISHRVVDSWNSEKGYTFKTKGDANNDQDQYDVKSEEIIGTVKFKVPFVGYPTVLLYNLTH